MTERELLKVLSSNIKWYRAGFAWSQADLAEKINISINFLSDIETGKKWPSPTTMVKISEAFRIGAWELLKPKGTAPEDTGRLIQNYTDDLRRAIDVIYARYTSPDVSVSP